MNLGTLKYADGSRKKRKRIARGTGSGHGGTSTRGHKGQMSRSGAKHRAWFEGGQMPIQRRMPKRGFKNIFREENQVVSLAQLDTLPGTLITPEVLLEHGFISHVNRPIKVLANGELKNAVKLEGLKVSSGARERIESAGGTIA
jgi:large subunit ribosomal protein L15